MDFEQIEMDNFVGELRLINEKQEEFVALAVAEMMKTFEGWTPSRGSSACGAGYHPMGWMWYYRNLLGWNQWDLAHFMNVPVRTVQAWEQGVRKPARLTYDLICKTSKRDLEALICKEFAEQIWIESDFDPLNLNEFYDLCRRQAIALLKEAKKHCIKSNHRKLIFEY